MTAYSNDNELLFIHIPKAGGKSAKKYLADHLPDLKGRIPGESDDESEPADFPKGHLNLRQACRVLGRDPSDFDRILAVRRNPYEQQFSQWTYWRRLRLHDESEDGFGPRLTMPQHEAAIMHPTFEAWLNDPRSQYHIYYDHLHRDEDTKLPEKKTGLTAEDFGGFYRFFVTDDNDQIPENLEMIDLTNLDERLPEIVEEITGERPESGVPRINEGPDIDESVEDHLTPEAARLIEERFRWSFNRDWYERRSISMRTEEGMIV